MDIGEALARLEIQSVLWTYARGVDRADYEALVGVYHPDATDHHCNFSGPAAEFAQDVIARNRNVTAVGQHHITNITIQMNSDDHAQVESYFLAFHPYKVDSFDRLGIVAGRYLDHFERRDGAWKIAKRRVVMDWTRDHVEGLPMASSDGKPVQGRRKAQKDDSYNFFAHEMTGV